MPKISASSLGEAAAMDSTFCRPPASSISTSMPMRRVSFSLASSWLSKRSTNCTSAARMALVSMTVSRFFPAPVTTSMMSSKHHSVVTSLTRTQRVFLPQSRPFRASTMVLRAPGLADGATASSRSRKTWSASEAAALAIIFSLTPGTESCERRRRMGRVVMGLVLSDRAGRAPARDVVVRSAVLAQHVEGVFAQFGAAAGDGGRGGGELDRLAGDAHRLGEARKLDGRQHVAGGGMGVVGGLVDVQNRAEGHDAAKPLLQLDLGQDGSQGRKALDHRRAVGGAGL